MITLNSRDKGQQLLTGSLALLTLVFLVSTTNRAQNPPPVTLPMPEPSTSATPPTLTITPEPRVRPSEPTSARLPTVADRLSFSAPSLNGARLPYRILLPGEYAKSGRRYPVLYLLHGLFGSENDWWQYSKLIEYAAKYRMIIVTPGVGDSWYANSASNPNARYEDVIVRDLIPYIDEHYRTISTREGRAIAGLSMGGLASMKFALRYPTMFAFAGSISGAFGVPRTARLGKTPKAKMLKDLRAVFGGPGSQTRNDNDVLWLLDHFQADRSSIPYLYISTGTSDPLPQVSESNPPFARALRAGNVKHEYYEHAGTHDWHFWDSEIVLMLGRMCVMKKLICN